MSATARVTILMEEPQKAALTRQARKAGMSVGEFIRSKALGEDDVLAALVTQLRESTRAATARIDEALARMDSRERTLVEREANIRRKARAEFAEMDAEALARLSTSAQQQAPARQRKVAA